MLKLNREPLKKVEHRIIKLKSTEQLSCTQLFHTTATKCSSWSPDRNISSSLSCCRVTTKLKKNSPYAVNNWTTDDGLINWLTSSGFCSGSGGGALEKTSNFIPPALEMYWRILSRGIIIVIDFYYWHEVVLLIRPINGQRNRADPHQPLLKFRYDTQL